MKAYKLIPHLWILMSLLFTIHNTAQNNIVGYEYAFDNDDAPTYVAILPTQDFNLVTDIDISSLPNDVNVFYIRFKDDLGQWSQIVSKIFVKPPEATASASTIVGYEYAFDDDNAPSYIAISPTQNFNLVTDIDVSSLPNDVNVFYIRFKDDLGQWSQIVSKIFVKPPESTATASTIMGYEYGFDDDNPPTYVAISPTQDFNLVTDIDVSSLPNDVNVFYIRFKDDIGQWSSLISKIFVKPPEAFVTASTIVGYEYGFNNGENIQYVPITPTLDLNLVTDIDISSLANTVNQVHIRFKDDIGQWSPMISKIFIKPPEPTTFSGNTIVAYDYWFDDDISTKVAVPVEPGQANFILVADIDVTQIWAGEHTINTQFKDAYDNYSVVMTDTINKTILPLANFTTDVTEICAGSTVNFTNTSIDFDDQLWNFDDGNTSTSVNTSYTFNTPGTFIVSLAIEDTSTGLVDATTQTIEVYELPINTVTTSTSLPACYGETVTLTADYANGDYLWSNGATTRSIDITSDGNYSVEISNSSTTLCSVNSGTINITFDPQIDNSITSDATTITANIAGASYQWIDCANGNAPIAGEVSQGFAPTLDGEYAVEITVNGCTVVSDCVTMSNLSIDDYNFDTQVKLFPNPVKDILQISTELNITIAVYNLLGKLVHKTELNAGEHQLNMSAYEQGIYLLKVVETDTYNSSGKVFRIIKK